MLNKFLELADETILTDFFKEEHKQFIIELYYFTKPVYDKADDAHNFNHIYCVMKRAIEMVNDHFNVIKIGNSGSTTNKLFMLRVKHEIYAVTIASFLHDIYSYSSRKDHHKKSYNFIKEIINILNGKSKKLFTEIVKDTKLDLNDKYICWVRYSYLELLKDASIMVLQHRASYKGKFSSIYSEIFNTADRDSLDINIVINRIYTCAKDNNCKFQFDINGNIPLNIVIENRSYHSEEIIPYLKNSLEWDNKKIKTFYHLWEKFSKVGYMFNKPDKRKFYHYYYKDNITKFQDLVDDIIVNPELMLNYLNK